VLAPDAPQHPEPCHGVRAEPDQPAGLLALVGLAALQRPDDEGQQRHEDGDAHEDHEPERLGGPQQDDGDDDVAGDGGDEAGEDVVQATEAHRVRGDRGHHVAGRGAARERLPGLGAVPADELDAPEGSAQPVRDGVPVAHRAGQGADGGEADQDAAPGEQRRAVARDHPVHGLAEGGRDQRLAHHPDDGEAGGDGEGVQLSPPHPAQESQGAAQVRGAGMLVGEAAHRGPRYAERTTTRQWFS